MPGNTTVYKSVRGYFPAVWAKKDIDASTNGTIKYFSQVEILPLPVKSSVVSITVVLSAALTAGDLNFRITKDGIPIGGGANCLMEPADGVSQTKTFEPGKVVVGKAKALGVNWNADAAMLPSGSIDAVIYFEVQPE